MPRMVTQAGSMFLTALKALMSLTVPAQLLGLSTHHPWLRAPRQPLGAARICWSPAPPSLARPGSYWDQLTSQPGLCLCPGMCPVSRAGTVGQVLTACPCSVTPPWWAPLLLVPQHLGMFISFWDDSAQKTDIHFTSYLTDCYWCKLKSALL